MVKKKTDDRPDFDSDDEDSDLLPEQQRAFKSIVNNFLSVHESANGVQVKMIGYELLREIIDEISFLDDNMYYYLPKKYFSCSLESIS